jgi:hypothetical protein
MVQRTVVDRHAQYAQCDMKQRTIEGIIIHQTKLTCTSSQQYTHVTLTGSISGWQQSSFLERPAITGTTTRCCSLHCMAMLLIKHPCNDVVRCAGLLLPNPSGTCMCKSAGGTAHTEFLLQPSRKRWCKLRTCGPRVVQSKWAAGHGPWEPLACSGSKGWWPPHHPSCTSLWCLTAI